MALTPTVENNVLEQENIAVLPYPTKTYYMELENAHIRGFADGLDSIRQVIFCALNTERSTYLAFSDDYGVELADLMGMPTSYVLAELERRISEALTWDSRIESVDNFEFEVEQRIIHVKFTVHTDFGNLDEEREVML